MRVHFTIPGKPFGWQRTGYNGKTGAIYKQDKTRTYQDLTALAYRSACKSFRFPSGTYVDMRAIAYYPIPQSASKADRQKMLDGEIRPIVKPDWDNIGKIIGDALNKIAYDDDKYIVDAQVRKFYSDRPRVEVILQEAGH